MYHIQRGLQIRGVQRDPQVSPFLSECPNGLDREVQLIDQALLL
jgi:hypothetical protein